MDKIRIINAAKQYLSSKNIDFAEPGELGRINGNLQEVIFLDPLIFDPNVAFVEPSDIRVWVNIKTLQTSLIEQM